MVRDASKKSLLTANPGITFTFPAFHLLPSSFALSSCTRLLAKSSPKNSSATTMVKTRGGRTTGVSSVLGKDTASASAPPPAPTLQCDWAATTFTSRDERKLRKSRLVADATRIRIPSNESRPKPPKGYAVMFVAFLVRGLSLPAHEFLRGLLFTYGIQLWQLTPNSLHQVAIFVTLCEAFI